MCFLMVGGFDGEAVGQQPPSELSLFNTHGRPSWPVNALPSQTVVPPNKQMYTTVGNTDRFHRPSRADRISSRIINAVPVQNMPKSLNLQVRGLVMMRDNAPIWTPLAV
jgi:hypothetical protein